MSKLPWHKLIDDFDRYAFVLLAFMLPLEKKLVPWLIALIILDWFRRGNFLQIRRTLRAKRGRAFLLFFALFYLLHLVGMLHTHYLEQGWFDLEVKMSLFIFPLMFLTLDLDRWPIRWRHRLLAAFVSGVTLSMLVSFAIASWNMYADGDNAWFFYTRLSVFHHPAYMAMYLNFAIVICLGFIFHKELPLSSGRQFLGYLLIVFFMLSVVLLSSKAGILGLIVVLFFTMIYLVFRQRRVLYGILSFGVALTLLYTLILLFPFSRDRIDRAAQSIDSAETLDPSSRESTAERLLVWEAALELSTEHFFTGVGTGDVVEELILIYKEKGISAAAEGRLNAHNQFLQTHLGLGLIGSLVLLLMILLPLAEALRKDDYFYAIFLLLFGFNLLFESMLQVQAGVIYYAFFNAWFYVCKQG